MERPDNMGDRNDQSNSNGNRSIQFSSTGNQRNLLGPSWTEKVRYGRDADVLGSRRGKCSTHSESFSDVIQRSTQSTYRMGITRIQDHQSIVKNKKRRNHNIYYPVVCAHHNDDNKDQFYEKPSNSLLCPRV
ncbi:unnamed protein product, partial [Schistosoma margrebowiei]